MNFSIEWTTPKDQNWGSEIGNGTWNGMVEQIRLKQVDIAACGLTVTFEREKVIDFNIGLTEEVITPILIPPQERSMNFMAFVDIFQKHVWATVAISIVLLALGN